MTKQILAQEFGNWCNALLYEDIPAPVILASRRAILDVIGVSAAGLEHEKVQALKNVVSATLVNTEAMALVHGMAAHIWDFDDTSYTGIMHGSAVVFPTVLAVARERNSSEKELITAFIIGSEIAYTLAEICGHGHYFKGWWSTATFGIIGATAAACRLLKLDGEKTSEAIGLAAAAAGGGKSVFGTHGKAYLVGDTASRSIGFARAALAGLSGPLHAFEDSRGFFELLNSGNRTAAIAATLGKPWRLCEPGLLFKTNPVCSAAHAAIEQMSALMNKSNKSSNEIISIEAEVPELVDISLTYPRPQSPQEAQFSLPYALACSALHGKVILADLQLEAIKSVEKFELMEKVSVKVADDLSTSQMREKFPESARLKITFSDGQQSSGFCGEAYGMPGRPLSTQDLLNKFHNCVRDAGHDVDAFDFENVGLMKLANKILYQNVETLPPLTKEESQNWNLTASLN